MTKTFVLFDCDGGSDDAWALILLLKAIEEFKSKSKDVILLGITISGCGNTNLYDAARNMLRILRKCNSEVDIFLGAEQSLLHVQDQSNFLPLFHGADGFGDVLSMDITNDEINSLVQPKHAVNAIQEFCTKHYQQVQIIAVGPLTNIALCYATFGESFAKSVAHIYIMGGNYQGVGNWTRAAEFNFHSDPEAAHIVLARSKCPVTIVPWEVCRREEFIVTMNWRLDYIGKQTTSSAIVLLNQVERAQWSKANLDIWIPCDLLAVVIFFFCETIVRKQNVWHATVDLNGSYTRGQMVLDHLHCVDKNPENVTVVELIDLEKFKNIVAWLANVEELHVPFSKRFI